MDAVLSVLSAEDDVVAGITGVPVSEIILRMPVGEVEGTRTLDGSVEVIKVVVVVDAVTDRRFVDVIVMVIVRIVSAIASVISEQMLYTLHSCTASLLGQLETRQLSAASAIVNPEGVVWVHRHVRSRLLKQLESW
jgi:hypothetical protein